MRFAQVTAVHAARRTVDLVLMDTGLRVAEVHILTSMVASDAGEWDLPTVPLPGSEQVAGALPTQGRALVATVDQAGPAFVVTGFLHPLGGQMAFTQDNRQVYRHASGAYTTIAPDGSIETWHPSGAYVRIGTGGHESLAPLSVNQAWKEVTNAPVPTITVHATNFNMTISPGGVVDLTAAGAATLHTGQVTWTTPALLVTGRVVAGYGGGDQVELQTHRHLDPDTSPAHQTLAPVAGT
jgi:hypothetical protein